MFEARQIELTKRYCLFKAAETGWGSGYSSFVLVAI